MHDSMDECSLSKLILIQFQNAKWADSLPSTQTEKSNTSTVKLVLVTSPKNIFFDTFP